MGCDGGTIPKRNELVRTKKKCETKDKNSEASFRWNYCYLSQQPLQRPIVVCGYGRLYNKTALIEELLDRNGSTESAKHIKCLNDVRELSLTPNPEKSEGSSDYICPVTQAEMNGNYCFLALWSCGCVFSERALKMINSEVCQNCLKGFEEEDVIVLNSSDENVLKLMEQRMEIRGKRNKTEKLSKKESKKKNKQRFSEPSSTNKLDVNTRSVCTVQQPLLKRHGIVKVPEDRTKKFKPNHNVVEDSYKSDVYKSLFTSRKSENKEN